MHPGVAIRMAVEDSEPITVGWLWKDEGETTAQAIASFLRALAEEFENMESA